MTGIGQLFDAGSLWSKERGGFSFVHRYGVRKVRQVYINDGKSKENRENKYV